MKQHYLLRRPVALAMLFLASACHKNSTPPAPRTVNYVLYTEKDFSGNHDTIRFEIIMKSGNQTLLDSPFALMTVAQIPGLANKIDVQTTVPEAYRNADLVVGFLYGIDNVGNSWWLDSAEAGNLHKIVTYNFR